MNAIVQLVSLSLMQSQLAAHALPPILLTRFLCDTIVDSSS